MGVVGRATLTNSDTLLASTAREQAKGWPVYLLTRLDETSNTVLAAGAV